MKSSPRKNKAGYSLLEMLVTLAIFAVLITMIVQVLVVGIESGRKIALRSKIRGDLSELALIVRRDFRNASKIDQDQCGSPLMTAEFPGEKGCLFTLGSTNYAWIVGSGANGCAEGKMCKFKYSGSSYELFYESSEALFIDVTRTSFELQVYQATASVTQGILLSTVFAEAANESADIPLQVRQVTIFTRNF